jgi:tetratricopeptide (TPR) repeat protein
MSCIVRIKGNLYQFKSPASEKARKAIAELLFAQGLTADGAGDKDAALERYRQAVNYDSGAAGIWLNMGTILFERRDDRTAEAYYRKALEIDPKYALAHFNLAIILEEKYSLQEALRHYLEAVTNDSQYGDAHYSLAGLYERFGEYRQAVKHYRLYLQHRDDDGETYPASARQAIERLQKRGPLLVSRSAASGS